MSNSVQPNDIPTAIQLAIVQAAMSAASETFKLSEDAEMAMEYARTTAEAGVRAWLLANGLSAEDQAPRSSPPPRTAGGTP